MLCLIWYHLYNLKSLKNTHGRVLFLVKLKVRLLHGCFSRFLNCINGTKSRNPLQLNAKRNFNQEAVYIKTETKFQSTIKEILLTLK